MSKYKIGRPLSDVRLRNWDGGRVAQLKLAVQRLEGEVNKTLAASVRQSAKRKVTGQVPFILDLSVNPGFRQASLHFSAPPGLGGHPRRQLLFYEIQHDTNENFGNPSTIQTPNTDVSIAGLGLGETRSFRVRTINTIGEASVWSTAVTVTLARNKIQQTAMSDVSKRLTKNIGEWQTIIDETWQPVDAKACLNVHVGLACPHYDVAQKVSGTTVRTFYGGPACAQFRWRIGVLNNSSGNYDFREKGVRAILSARPGFTSEASDYNSIRTPTAFATIMLPFFKPTSGSNMRIILEAAKMPGSEWKGQTIGRAIEISEPLVFTRRGLILEVLQGF